MTQVLDRSLRFGTGFEFRFALFTSDVVIWGPGSCKKAIIIRPRVLPIFIRT